MATKTAKMQILAPFNKKTRDHNKKKLRKGSTWQCTTDWPSMGNAMIATLLNRQESPFENHVTTFYLKRARKDNSEMAIPARGNHCITHRVLTPKRRPFGPIAPLGHDRPAAAHRLCPLASSTASDDFLNMNHAPCQALVCLSSCEFHDPRKKKNWGMKLRWRCEQFSFWSRLEKPNCLLILCR